jgi:hypothetical protein
MIKQDDTTTRSLITTTTCQRVALECNTTADVATSHFATFWGVAFSIQSVLGDIDVRGLELNLIQTNVDPSVKLYVADGSNLATLMQDPTQWTLVANASFRNIQVQVRNGVIDKYRAIIPAIKFPTIKIKDQQSKSFVLLMNGPLMDVMTNSTSGTIADTFVVGAPAFANSQLRIATGMAVMGSGTGSATALFAATNTPAKVSGMLYYTSSSACASSITTITTVEYELMTDHDITSQTSNVLASVATALDYQFSQSLLLQQWATSYGLTRMPDMTATSTLYADACPNGWTRCYAFRIHANWQHTDELSSGNVEYEMIRFTFPVTDAVQSNVTTSSINTAYIGSKDAAVKYTTTLSNVQALKEMDAIQTAYFEKATLAFIQSKQVRSQALGVRVDAQTPVNRYNRVLVRRGRNRELQAAHNFDLVVHGSIVAQQDALYPLANFVDEVTATLTADQGNAYMAALTGSLLYPDDITTNGEWQYFANMTRVKVVMEWYYVPEATLKPGTAAPGRTAPTKSPSGKNNDDYGRGGMYHDKPASNNSNIGVAIGVTIGVVLMVLLCCFAYWFCYLRRRNTKEPINDQEQFDLKSTRSLSEMSRRSSHTHHRSLAGSRHSGGSLPLSGSMSQHKRLSGAASRHVRIDSSSRSSGYSSSYFDNSEYMDDDDDDEIMFKGCVCPRRPSGGTGPYYEFLYGKKKRRSAARLKGHSRAHSFAAGAPGPIPVSAKKGHARAQSFSAIAPGQAFESAKVKGHMRSRSYSAAAHELPKVPESAQVKGHKRARSFSATAPNFSIVPESLKMKGHTRARSFSAASQKLPAVPESAAKNQLVVYKSAKVKGHTRAQSYSAAANGLPVVQESSNEKDNTRAHSFSATTHDQVCLSLQKPTTDIAAQYAATTAGVTAASTAPESKPIDKGGVENTTSRETSHLLPLNNSKHSSASHRDKNLSSSKHSATSLESFTSCSSHSNELKNEQVDLDEAGTKEKRKAKVKASLGDDKESLDVSESFHTTNSITSSLAPAAKGRRKKRRSIVV